MLGQPGDHRARNASYRPIPAPRIVKADGYREPPGGWACQGQRAQGTRECECLRLSLLHQHRVNQPPSCQGWGAAPQAGMDGTRGSTRAAVGAGTGAPYKVSPELRCTPSSFLSAPKLSWRNARLGIAQKGEAHSGKCHLNAILGT